MKICMTRSRVDEPGSSNPNRVRLAGSMLYWSTAPSRCSRILISFAGRRFRIHGSPQTRGDIGLLLRRLGFNRGGRESPERALGYEKFMKLGFCDMGESVAKKWTINMQNSFRRVVLSNPASSGRNFWHRLAAAFPARSSEELVGYYFNVFVLRKRAEQNRVDPLNTDSDNDEWGESSSDEKDDFLLECGYERNFSEHDEPGGEDCDH